MNVLSRLMERRRFPRISSDSQVRFRVLDETGPADRSSLLSILRNISGGGVSFLAETPVPEGRFVALDMTLPVCDRPVVALGQVKRCRRLRNEGRYDVAVEFWWTGWGDEAAQRSIATYIQGALREPEGEPARS